jgi:hypothetical protein
MMIPVTEKEGHDNGHDGHQVEEVFFFSSKDTLSLTLR